MSWMTFIYVSFETNNSDPIEALIVWEGGKITLLDMWKKPSKIGDLKKVGSA